MGIFINNLKLKYVMKKFFALVLIIVACSISTASAQLLYKISGNGLTKPSYILGTYHLLGPDFLDKVKGLENTANEVEQFCGELSLQEYIKLTELMQTMVADSLPNGQTLRDIFKPKEFDSINARTKAVFGMGFNESTELLQSFGRLMPAQYASLLQGRMYMEILKEMPELPLDVALIIAGKELGKEVIGLESAEFQLKLLNPQIPLKKQRKILLNIVNNWDKTLDILKAITETYQTQDMATMSNLLMNKHNRKYLYGQITSYKEFIGNRDADWARRMPDIMREKSTFFFVGCFHLAGKPGVLNLLRAQGYTVEPVQ